MHPTMNHPCIDSHSLATIHPSAFDVHLLSGMSSAGAWWCSCGEVDEYRDNYNMEL